MKVKNKKGLIITIIVSCILLITAISFLIWYFNQKADIKQLKNSPFLQTGVWYNNIYNFEITADKENDELEEITVIGVMLYDIDEYGFKLYYEENKDKNSKYDYVIYLEGLRGETKYSCFYEFKENEFTLKEFKYIQGDKVFLNINLIKFTKQ